MPRLVPTEELSQGRHFDREIVDRMDRKGRETGTVMPFQDP